MGILPGSTLTGAIFDSTGIYRYSLWRVWDRERGRVIFIMLNPSTADAEHNDPTITRCIGLAQHWGYGALEVVNLFAYRTSSPIALRQVREPIGMENDRYVLTAVMGGDRTVVAWGNWGRLHGRDRAMLSILSRQSDLYCLGINQSGQPRHPLYTRRNIHLSLFCSARTSNS